MKKLHARDWTGIAFLLAGFILRLRQYLANRSLWLDEAMLTNNILARSFGGLTQPLANDQGAPIGFLFLEKTVTLLFGDSEYALRLFPFLAGCLALFLMFLLVRKTASAPAGSLALALFAFSPALVYYSSEVKQYSTDAAIALTLILLYLNYEGAPLKPRDGILLALAGSLAIWFSHPALFILAGLGLALFIPAVRARDARNILTLVGIALVWAVSLVVLYFLNLRQLASHQFFLDFWREGFMPQDASAWRWLLYSLQTPFLDLLGLRIPYLLIVGLFLAGFIVTVLRSPRFGLFLGVIFLSALVASFLELYPFAGRMLLFLTPPLILLLAGALDAVTALLPRPRGLAWAAILVISGFLLFAPLRTDIENFISPKMQEHIRPALQALSEEMKPGDVVYVYHWTEHAVRYYAPKYHLALEDFIFGADHHDQPSLYAAELDALRGRQRVWFIFSHVYEQGSFNERDFILETLDSIGELTRQVRLPGTSVYLYLYDLAAPSP